MNVNVKNLLFVILYLLSANAFASLQTQVEDQALQSCLEKIAKSKGWSTAEEFTAIKCNSQNIRSLAGIESFTNITSLSVFNNRIEQLNDNLTKLTKLEVLNVARNNVKTLHLQGFAALKQVYAFDNGTTSMRFADLQSLEMIKAQNNKASSFIYENTPKLAKIYIFNNELEHMDIYSLPSLQYVDCRQNPMPDPLYDEMDAMEEVTFLHDGNADDW